MFDYNERRQHINRNRPKGRNIGVTVLAVAGALIIVFGLGFGTGWFAGRASVPRLPESAGVTKLVPPPAPTQPPPGAGVVTPPLTFYETLPKGSKAVLGTGINSGAFEKNTPANTPATAPVVEQKRPDSKKENDPGTVKPAISSPDAADGSTTAPVLSQGTKYTVQVSSYQSKQEAEAERDRLIGKGFPAYVRESHSKDKGVWYRVRTGRSLERKEAASIAAKVGSGAFVVPE